MKHLLLTTIAAVVLVGCCESAIHKAIANTNIEAVKQAIAAGADVNKIDGGRTPLHVVNLLGGHKEITGLLIDNGANVKAESKYGSTPLQEAALGGHKEIVELLIDKGADVSAKYDFGKTPLDYAIGRKHPETADLLRKHGGKTGEELKVEGR